MASKSKTESDKAQQQLGLEELLDDLTNRLERLKVLYEQYFMGIEKIEPLVARKDVTRTMIQLQQQYIRNTGLRFRFSMMLQKWNIYLTYWNRTLREIENGTYTKHLAKVQRSAQKKGYSLPDEMKKTNVFRVPKVDDHDDSPFEDAPDSRATTRPAGVAPTPSPKPAPSSPVPGMSADELRSLYNKYATARQQAGQPPVQYETLVRSLEKQVPALMSPGVRSVSFDVATQDGKAVLKATQKK